MSSIVLIPTGYSLPIVGIDGVHVGPSLFQVLVDLKPLVKMDGVPKISGWFPVYDTIHGIRGALHISVKLQLFRYGRHDLLRETGSHRCLPCCSCCIKLLLRIPLLDLCPLMIVQLH